ncbi:nucleolar 27S pre-rRNA processing, Urb2/Npa2, partial [Pseudohyphozyma bogoriensis]
MATPGTLLYTLKGSQPIPVKLAAARSSLLATPTATTSTQIRDWALDALLKSTKSSASTLILNSEVWTTLEESLQAATGAAQTPTLPTFSSFVKAYSGAEERDEALLRVVVGVSRKLLPNGIRKASLDAALESWKELLEASLKVFAEESANEEEQKEWCELVGLWEKNVRSVGEAGKGGKK